jgi:hypothetical protein
MNLCPSVLCLGEGRDRTNASQLGRRYDGSDSGLPLSDAINFGASVVWKQRAAKDRDGLLTVAPYRNVPISAYSQDLLPSPPSPHVNWVM